MNIEISVNRVEVLNKLKANKEKHIETYKESLRGYRVECVKFFEEQLALARNGEDFKTSFNGSKPTNYTDDYDLAISMFQYHVEETISLDTNDARCFLEDKWNWSNSFSTSNSFYKTGSLWYSPAGYNSDASGSIKFSSEEL
jgi:hypothetical protein